MSDQWYYSSTGDKVGPFSSQELRDLARAGSIQPTDTVWKEGVERGVVAARVRYLFESQAGVAAEQPPADPGIVQQQVAAVAEAATVMVSPEPPGPADSTPLESPPHNFGGQPEQPAAVPPEEPPVEAPPAPKPKQQNNQPKPKKGHAIASRGAVIVSQDGDVVHFRKKCTKCGHEDASKSRMPIRNGASRQTYFCPKCRKLMSVEIQCSGK